MLITIIITIISTYLSLSSLHHYLTLVFIDKLVQLLSEDISKPIDISTTTINDNNDNNGNYQTNNLQTNNITTTNSNNSNTINNNARTTNVSSIDASSSHHQPIIICIIHESLHSYQELHQIQLALEASILVKVSF